MRIYDAHARQPDDRRIRKEALSGGIEVDNHAPKERKIVGTPALCAGRVRSEAGVADVTHLRACVLG
jgi:hypothetical protein